MENKQIEHIQNSNAIIHTLENNDIDVLDRSTLIDQIIKVIEYYADKNHSVSFSIQGSWGIGKSWIINNLAAELYNMQDINIPGGKYCVLKFNPWEYDYYNEPLMSLILSLKNQVNSEKAIFPINEEHIQMFKYSMDILSTELVAPILDLIGIVSGNPAVSFLGKFFVNKTKIIKHDLDKKTEDCKKQKRFLNPYLDLEDLMKVTITGLNKISNNKTVILLIDELDRCLPEYAIKVLERMHHITQSVNNLQIIYSIDKKQIEETVRKIFGVNANTSDYLKKFYSFSFNLSSGFLNEKFLEKYEKLFNKFDFIFTDNFDKEKAFISILSEINMREREYIIQKIELINSILNKNNEVLDIAVLYVEIFIAYCFTQKINIFNGEIHYENDNLYFTVENDTPQFEKSAFISKFFDGLVQSHNVKHELHGYDGFYKANIEYVVFNLLNNCINIQLPEYSIAWETDFYTNGAGVLNNFVKLYKDIEM